MKMNRKTTTLIAAITLIGVAALSWTLWRARPTSSPGVAQNAAAERAESAASRPDPGQWTRVDAPEDIARVRNALEQSVRSRVESSHDLQLSASRAGEIASEVASYFAVVLEGTPQALSAFLQDRGGSMDISSLSEDRRKDLAAIWGGFRMRPVGLDGVIVRKRPSGALDLEAAPFGERSKIKLADTNSAVPGLRGQVRRTDRGDLIVEGESYEVIVPILHEMDGVETPVFIGVLMTRSRSQGRWLPSATIIYAPNFVTIGSAPF